MTDDGGNRQNHPQVRSAGDKASIFAGVGNQYVTYGGPSMRTVLVGVVLAALVAGLVQVPEGSTGQHVVYWLLLCGCGAGAVVALWWGFDGTLKALRVFVGLVVTAVVCVGLACGGYVSLEAHGDLSALPVTTDDPGPLLNEKGSIHTYDVSAPVNRSSLRVTVDLQEARPEFDTCITSALVTLVPVVNGSPDDEAGVDLPDGGSADIALPGTGSRLQLKAHVHSTTPGEKCRLNLRFDSAVLHDDTWWLP